jgi:oxygen-independent coproporphyrinogen-3 oxidase
MSDPAADPACGCSEPVTGSYFVSAYPPFDAWTRESLAGYRELLERPPARREPLGLYVHIPFWERRCDFCYYLSYEGSKTSEVDAYLAALPWELERYRALPAIEGRPFDYVYFGGGTPSLLSLQRLDTLLTALAEQATPWNPREFTFECAPRSITRDKLQLLRDRGVTRISLGVQQLNDRILQLNGRVHLTRDVERAIEAIRDVGFEILNIDLIVGLVGETDSTFFDSLEEVLAMEPESATLYQLEIPHNTPLFRGVGAGTLKASIPSWEVKRRRLRRAFERFEEEGYSINSGYLAVRDPRKHAFLYQDLQYGGADLLGLGASSFSYLGGMHQQNLADLDSYLAAAGRDELPLSRAFALDTEDQLIRETVLQLKLGGIDCEHLAEKFGRNPREYFAEAVSELLQQGWLAVEGPNLTLTRDGLLRVDSLLQRFYPVHAMIGR